MGSRSSMCLSFICCFMCFASPFVILITLIYVGGEPRFYVQQLYMPALNHSQTYNASNLNSSIIIDFKFKAYDPLRYHNLNITLYYGSNTSFSVGHYVLPGFSQRKKTARRRVVVEALGLPWEDALDQMVSGNSTVTLTVQLATKYELKRCSEGSCYYTNGKTVVVAVDVVVGSSGADVAMKAIRLH